MKPTRKSQLFLNPRRDHVELVTGRRIKNDVLIYTLTPQMGKPRSKSPKLNLLSSRASITPRILDNPFPSARKVIRVNLCDDMKNVQTTSPLNLHSMRKCQSQKYSKKRMSGMHGYREKLITTHSNLLSCDKNARDRASDGIIKNAEGISKWLTQETVRTKVEQLRKKMGFKQNNKTGNLRNYKTQTVNREIINEETIKKSKTGDILVSGEPMHQIEQNYYAGSQFTNEFSEIKSSLKDKNFTKIRDLKLQIKTKNSLDCYQKSNVKDRNQDNQKWISPTKPKFNNTGKLVTKRMNLNLIDYKPSGMQSVQVQPPLPDPSYVSNMTSEDTSFSGFQLEFGCDIENSLMKHSESIEFKESSEQTKDNCDTLELDYLPESKHSIPDLIELLLISDESL